MDNAAEIKEYYSQWWENPRDIRNVVFESLNGLVRKRIPQGNGAKALDIGSGHGRIVSYLIEKGYEVTAVEFNEHFAAELRNKFPGVNVIQQDIRNLDLHETFDVITMIEVTQNLDRDDLADVLGKLSLIGKLLLVNISNKNSLHARWLELRRFLNSFVFPQTPGDFDRHLESAGFRIAYRRGVGLATPISLFGNFRGKLIPVRLAKAINKLDRYFTKLCHLYYVEAFPSTDKSDMS